MLLAQATGDVRVRIDNLSAAPGTRGIVRAVVDNAKDIAGGTFRLSLPDFATAEEASTTADTSGFLIASRSESGQITVAMACATGLPEGPAALFTFPIRLNQDAPQGKFALTLREVQLYDQTPELTAYTSSAGLFTVLQAPTDSDQDGLPDQWETYCLGTLESDGDDDPDADGASNRSEFLAGTDPNSAASVFRVQCFESSLGDGWPAVVLQWPGQAEMNYEVFWSDGPIGPAMAWHSVYRPVYQTEGQLLQWIDDGTRTHSVPLSNNERYYRVVASKP